MADKTRWGILSAGKISEDFTKALLMAPNDHEVCAVAARDVRRAQEFATRFSIPRAYGTYQELAADPKLDIIYVGCIHPFHHDVCKLLITAGKNILCEKPLTMNVREMKELFSLAKQKNTFLAEGFWSRYFPAYKQLNIDLKDGLYGEAKFVNVNFGFPILNKERIVKKELGGGALLDLGCYGIQFAQFIFKEKPERIVASGILTGDDGVDICTCVTLTYSGGRVAQINCHTDALLTNTAHVYCTKGIVEMPFFWNPSEYTCGDRRFHEPLPSNPPFPMFHMRSEGFVYEAQGVRHALLKGAKECDEISQSESIIIMEVLDEVRRQIGVIYDADSL